MNTSSPEAFFNRLYDAHRRAVYAYFMGRFGNAEAAEDLLQETFLRAWRSLPRLREMDDDRRRYWVFTVARNLATDRFRRRALRPETEALDGYAETLPSFDRNADAKLEEEEMLNLLDGAVRRLPEDQRTVLVMTVAGGMTSAEIAAALEKPAGTVRYHLSMARKRLSEALKESEERMGEEMLR